MASIYLRGRVWWVCYMDSGRKTDKSLKTKDKKVAQFRKNEIENMLVQGDSPILGKAARAKECFEQFKNSRTGVLDPKTTSVVNQRIQDFLDDTKINNLSAITEESVKAHLDRRIREDKISPKTANHSIVQIGTFLTYCLRKKYIKENPLRWMKRYRMDPIVPRFLSTAEAEALLLACKKTEIYDIILIAIYAGLRWGEIARLQWEDFNIDKNEIMVRKSKTNKFRVVPIAEGLHKDLIPRKGKGSITSLSYDDMERVFTEIRDNLKIGDDLVPHFRLHDLRHTFASMAIKNGVDLLTLSKWLGHSTTRTTELYAHLYDDHSQAAMKKFKL